MKTLRKLNIMKTSLAGELETLTIMEFRSAPGEVFKAVQFGREFVITKKGKPIALLTSFQAKS